MLAGLYDGKSLRAVCKPDDMPHEATVRTWVRDDREGFATHYVKAREIGYHCMADELLEIADDGTNDFTRTEDGERLNAEHVQRSRLRLDTRKWLLSKALPKIYGDKQAVEHSGPNGDPIKTEAVGLSAKEVARQVAFLLAQGMQED